MRYLTLICFCFIIILQSCKSNKPDVSDIKANLTVERFEKDMFTADTGDLKNSMQQLLSRYPDFLPVYFSEVINADMNWAGDTLQQYLGGFIKAYRPVYDTALKVFKDFRPLQKEIEQTFRYTKYYFPAFVMPKKIITFVGPLDGLGNFMIDDDVVAIGLNQYLGAGYSLYNSELVQAVYPVYISRRFTPEYISLNIAKTAFTNLYPEAEEDIALVEQMVQQGKRLYVLQKLLPEKSEDIIMGYTKDQLEGSYKREALIWAFFLQNNILQSYDYGLIKNYIGDSPKTQELGEDSPGNIGAFCGWQIVKKYMSNHSDLSLDALMKLSPSTIYREAKYKP